MEIKIKDTFAITIKKLFVIIVDIEFDNLLDFHLVLDYEKKNSYVVNSIEIINQLNVTYSGITLKYQDDEEMKMLSTIFKDKLIAVK